jgi:site-specific DNA-cytosine methylase
VQTEKSGTLGTGNDQTIFCLQGNGIDRADTAGCNGKGWKTDESYTLNTIDRPAVCAEVACMNPWDAQSARVYDQDGAWHSLNANENGGMARDSVLCAGFKLGNSEQARSIGYQEELSPTLNAECGGNKPAVVAPAAMAFDTTQITSKETGSQPEFGKPCHTLNANAHVPCVALDMTHACDVIRECGEQVPALQARMGTGGNQVPLTYQMNGFGDYRAAEVASSCKQRDFKDSTDLAITHMVVRRLTPMECERLQGFPDHWTDIGEWIDGKGKRHKPSDSPRYKALGNSIALPFWDWMLRRMARYLPEGATLGSLFDGIAGFPLIWERIHGKGTARWASEIEPFPIAVTKKHFPEEE